MSATVPPSDRARVAATRAVHRARGAQRSRGDTAYVVYVSVLVAAIAGVPIVRTIVLALATPSALHAFSHENMTRIISVLGALIWMGALILGRRRGPIAPQPFVATTLGRSDISPSTAWLRDLVGAASGVTLALGALAALAVSGFLTSGDTAGPSIAFIVGVVLFALPTTAIWLAGQVLTRRAASALGVALALLLIATAALPRSPLLPASALAELWPSTGGAMTTALIVLSVVGAGALVSIAILLRGIPPTAVEEHALRWEAMTVLAATGDISGALDRTRAQPTAGRRVRVPLTRPLIFAVLQRATVGAMRTPLRVSVALVSLIAAGAGWAWFAHLQHDPRGVLAVGIGLLTFAALGAFSDGFREAADAAGRPALYGQTAGRMLLLQAPLSILAAAVIPTTAALLAGSGIHTAAAAATVSVTLIAVRAYDATKGAMPIELMMPVPTPAGDASAIGVWAWQMDALLWAAVMSFWLSTSSATSFMPLLWAVPVVALLAVLTAGRLRRAAS